MSSISAKKTRKTKREQGEESIRELLGAARSLFVTHGYKATTLDQIASAAGLSKGAVYFHFGSKEAVLVQLLKLVEVEVIIPVVEILQSQEISVAERLTKFTLLHGEMGITRRQDLLLLILMSLEFADQEGEAADYIRRLYSDLYKPLEVLIRKGQTSGEIRNDAPSAELASVVVATHDGAFLEWYRRGRQLDGKQLVQATLTVLLRGL